jgi:F-type H+-transporting ATPase subunit 6
LATELDKVAKQYGGGKGIDMTKFPQFAWTEPEIQDIELREKSN